MEGYFKNAPEVTGGLAALLADTHDAQVVRTWCKENSRPNLGGLRRMSGGQDCEDWEAELWALVGGTFVLTKPISARERAGKTARKRKADAAANKARTLAAALEDEAGPQVPSVLALFGTDRAVDIIDAMPRELAQSLLWLTGYSADPNDGYRRTKNPVYSEDGQRSAWQDPAANLARHFGGAWGSAEAAQLFPDLLRRLAEYIEATADLGRPRIPRPNTKNGDAIAFAHQIHHSFLFGHGKTPWDVIAALVRIRHPEVDPPPDEADVKGWIDHKPDQ